jgi:hypothetical protein
MVIKSQRIRWAGHVTCMGHMRNEYKILVTKLEGKRPHRRPRHRWTDNIRMDVREIGWEDVDRIRLAEDMGHWLGLVNTVMNLQVPSKAGSFFTS